MNAKHIPYFNFYPVDFMHGVRGLTAQEVGVYTMLLCRIYEESGPVKLRHDVLATYCGMRLKTFTAVLDRLVELGKLQVADGLITNARAMAEISTRANNLKNKSKAGKVSAEIRKKKQRPIATDVDHLFNHTNTNTDTDTDTDTEGDKSPSTPAHAHETVEPLSTPPGPPAPPEPGGDFDTASANLRKQIMAAYRDAGSMAFPDTHRATVWLRQGRDPAIIVAVIRDILSRKTDIRNLAYFDNPIATAHQPPAPGMPQRPPDKPSGNRGGFSAAAREAMNDLREIWRNPDDDFQQEPDYGQPPEPEILPPDESGSRHFDHGGTDFFDHEIRAGRSPNVVDFGKARAFA